MRIYMPRYFPYEKWKEPRGFFFCYTLNKIKHILVIYSLLYVVITYLGSYINRHDVLFNGAAGCAKTATMQVYFHKNPHFPSSDILLLHFSTALPG